MKYWLNLYRANLRVAIANMLQYRFTILIWAVWGFVGPLISLAVWSAASAARGGTIVNKTTGASFAAGDFAAYFLVFMIFGHIMMSWDAFEFASRVQNGGLSPALLKPVHPIHRDAASNIAFKLTTSAMLLPVWALLFVMLKPHITLNAFSLLAIPALVMGAMLRYVLQYTLALAAFWTTRVDAINQLYNTLDSFLAGRIAPISLMPGWIAGFALYSPFRAMGSFPVELALGRVPAEQILPGFALQSVWLCVAILLLRALWTAGIKQYSSVGA
ncbi:MAG: hypothetical protein JWN14_13 [Chthonomonadales bacterium]|nr:hypothetical protein [Chthonomonadales bacterium]